MSNSDNWPIAPRLRAGNQDRDKTAVILANAQADGKLTIEEFSERNGQIAEAKYRDELESLITDLGHTLGSQDLTTTTSTEFDQFRADDESLSAQLLPARIDPEAVADAAVSLGFWSESELSGRWVIDNKHIALAIMGGNTIDLTNAVFVNKHTTITCMAVMGGVEVVVPPNITVRVSGISIMGGFGWGKKPGNRILTDDPNTPIVTINGLSLMGSVSVIDSRDYQLRSS